MQTFCKNFPNPRQNSVEKPFSAPPKPPNSRSSKIGAKILHHEKMEYENLPTQKKPRGNDSQHHKDFPQGSLIVVVLEAMHAAGRSRRRHNSSILS